MTTTDQPLDRRRDKASSAEAAATAARAAVTDLDHQLETVSGLTVQQEQALHRAIEEAARLRRSLKAAGKRQAELTRKRKKAVVKADRAGAKAADAEQKYDKEVLADLVRREKQKDRDGSAVQNAEPEAAEAKAPAAPAKAGLPPEKPAAATQTARRTAARKTARLAR